MSERLWLLNIQPKAERDIRDLPRKDALAVLDAIDRLLLAENPLADPGVKKVKGEDHLWRARQGNYRILFTLDTTPITEGERTYKGTLIVINVRKRDESTYR